MRPAQAIALVAGVSAYAAAACTATAAPKEFAEEDVTAAVREIVAERSKEGTFVLHDARGDEDLRLVLDDVRIVRGLPGFGWFPNVVFRDSAAPAKKYAIDFWLKPDGGRLQLIEARVHKAPQPDGNGWMSITRAPLPWWWLPTIERASAVSGIPAWKVMGEVHSAIAATRQDGLVPLKTDGGKDVTLQLVDVEQPVGRSKDDGRYFACALLREPQQGGLFYSAAYWLDTKTHQVRAGSVKPIGEARGGEQKAAAEPRCDVGGIAYDIVD